MVLLEAYNYSTEGIGMGSSFVPKAESNPETRGFLPRDYSDSQVEISTKPSS